MRLDQPEVAAYNLRMNKQGQQKRVGMGIVGAGFVGPHHLDAVRRLGFVDIVAVAGSNEESGRRKAEQLSACCRHSALFRNVLCSIRQNGKNFKQAHYIFYSIPRESIPSRESCWTPGGLLVESR